MIALGIDPGTATTGYGIVKDCPDGRLISISYGVIRTDSKSHYSIRLREIYEGILSLIECYKPDAMAIEQLFFNKNVSSALSVGQARGVVILTAALSGIQLSEYTPIQVKEAVTGYGRADKHQIQHMIKMLLGFDDIPKPDDAADALALAICHLNSYKIKHLIDEKDFIEHCKEQDKIKREIY